MAVRAFVSSTKEDLKDDCRPAVIKAIRSENAEAVEMDGWDAGHEPVIALCCDKLSDSTHYVGVFAFRYGGMPPGLGKSITELEFELARESLELRARNFQLGVAEYGLALEALASGFGTRSRADLIATCQALWAKSPEEQREVAMALESVMPPQWPWPAAVPDETRPLRPRRKPKAPARQGRRRTRARRCLGRAVPRRQLR